MNSAVMEYVTQVNPVTILTKNVIVGTDVEGRPSVLIRNSDKDGNNANFENKFFIMKNGVVLEHDSKTIGNYHVLICKKNDLVSVEHFKRVCDYLFVKSDNSCSSEEMLKLFYSLETIFSVKSEKNFASEVGFYGELSVINYFYEKHIGNLYKTWHKDMFNKHDFEITKNKKIEVKSTTKDVRIHSFRHNQIMREGMYLYVVSCVLQTCEKGLSLLELSKNTIDILDDNEQKLAIELMINKLGLCNGYEGINCIKEETYENIAIYNANKIPRITSPIPSGVLNVCYDVDFTNVEQSCFAELIQTNDDN